MPLNRAALLVDLPVEQIEFRAQLFLGTILLFLLDLRVSAYDTEPFLSGATPDG